MAEAALGQVDSLLAARQTGGSVGEFRPKSLKSAVAMSDADWVLISVNGRYAAAVADEALELGKHVFLYSDNVSIEDERKLKQKAVAKGLLVMGPDCGTAIINGIGLGFANRVRRGRFGIVAASGTGLQYVSSAIHQNGEGVSQAIGTGGRDLKDAIGGLTMLQGLELLAQDAATECILIVSKPPSPAVARAIIGRASQLDKPVVINFIGYATPAESLGNIYFAQSLLDTAGIGIGCVDLALESYDYIKPAQGYLRGLFSGGTLAYEAVMVAATLLPDLQSNVGVGSAEPVSDVMHSQGHTIIDMGADDFTQGRLHPMMDNDLRIRRIRQEAADPTCGIIMLDIVLGEGSHPDPASEIAPVISEIKSDNPDLAVIVIVVGTDDDPQDLAAQVAQFEAAGAHVTNDTRLATVTAVKMLAPTYPITRSPDHIPPTFSAINIGLESFHESILSQGGKSIQVDWKPPAGGNEKMMALLARLKAAKKG